jgi:hypothetical protein
MGEDCGTILRRLVGIAALSLLLLPIVTACLAEPQPPDLSSREDFARSVMTAAVSGSVAKVEGLVDPGFSNVGPEAQQLVDSTKGWTAGSWQLDISTDFPEIANVTARRPGRVPAVRYTVSWSGERWTLVMGEPVMGESKNRPSVGAKPIGPGADPKIIPSGSAGPDGIPSPEPSASASGPARAPAACPVGTPRAAAGVSAAAGSRPAELACRTFTSTSGYARGRNMFWLTSTPLHLNFDRMTGESTMVVRMPCGVLNVPVAPDDFALVPVPARMAESADGCMGPASEHRSWTSAFFKDPMVYQLGSSELVLTNELGQIRFEQD